MSSLRHITSWALALLSLLAVIAASLHAQDLPPDRFEVMVKFDKGRLVCDRATATLTLSDGYRRRLRAGTTDDRLKKAFADSLDREFRLMPKPYFYTLTDDEKALDLANRLKNDPEINKARNWPGDWRTFPRLQFFVEDSTSFSADLNKVATRSGLAGYLPPDSDNIARLPRVFRVRETFAIAEVELPARDEVIEPATVRKLLARFEGLPGNPDAIRSVLLNYYAVRGITPRIDADLDGAAKKIAIFKADRIAHLELPLEADTVAEAELIAYETMPERVYQAFRKQGAQVLAVPLETGARKRPVDIDALVRAAEGPGATAFMLPFNEALLLQAQQQRLLPLGYQASLFDFQPDLRLVDLVIDKTTQQGGASTARNPVLASADTPENASHATARPGALSDIQPAPVAPAPGLGEGAGGQAAPGMTPRLAQKTFVGGGLEYRPEQGVRYFGRMHRTDLIGHGDQLSAEAGGQGGGFGSAAYVRDYVAFGTLHRRLSVSVNGGTDFTQQRILAGVLTDERRSGGAARAELEIFRNYNEHQLLVSLEGRRHTVYLIPENGSETAANLTTIDVGLTHQWNRRLVNHPASLHLSPLLRLGPGVGAGEPTFQLFQADATYHSLLAGPIEADVHLRSANASQSTPIFELPSLGAEGSVRGFRSDDAIGQTLWSVQSELWFPLVAAAYSTKFLDFVRRNLRLAGFYDLGGLYSGGDTSDGVRQGVGAGLRLRYQGVVLALDWAYGFGKGALDNGHGRFYFNIRLP